MKKSQGAILVLVLIWLFVLTLLLVGVAEQVLLMTRASSLYRDHLLAFSAAEIGLQLASFKIRNQPLSVPEAPFQINNIIKYKGTEGAAKIFDVISDGQYHQAHVRLECQYVLLNQNIAQRNWQEIF